MAYNRKTRPKMARNKYGFIKDDNVVTTSSLMESASNSSTSSSSSLSQFSATIWGNALTHNSYLTEGLTLDYKSTDSTTPYSWFKSALFNSSYGIDLTSTYYTDALGYTHAFTLGPWKAYTSYVDGIHKSFMECNTIYTDLLTSSSSIIDADKNLRAHSIVPSLTETYDLGSSSLLWKKLWAKAASISSLYTDNIVNEDTILTHNLEVTGSAHFAEIIIDKIKSTSGQFLLTPIDGFEVVAVEDNGTYYTLYFLMEKDGKTITNDWAIGDYALCKNFFGLKTGVSKQVSNQYYWREVLEASDTSIEIEGVLTLVNYIEISKSIGDGDSVPKVGDNVILCGHKYNSEDASAEWAKQRGSAIYFGTQKGLDYDNETRDGLTPPFFAQYEGILYNGGDASPSTYNLNPYRQSYFDATGAKFCGNFTVGGKDVKDYIDDKVSTSSFSIAIMNVSTDNNKLTWKAVGYQTVNGVRQLMSDDYEIGVILNQDTACESGYYQEDTGVWRQDNGSLVDSKGNAVTKLTFGIWSLDDGTVEGETPYYTMEYLLSEDSAIMDLIPTKDTAWVQLNTDTSKLELYYYLLYTLTRVTETSSSPIAKSSTKKVFYKWQYDDGTYGTEWEMGEYGGDASTAYATGQYENYDTEYRAGNAPIGVIISYKDNGETIVTKRVGITSEANTVFTIDNKIGRVQSQILDKFDNYSTITQTAEKITLAVDDLTDDLDATGIDIENGKITITADNTIVNGNLEIDSAKDGEGIIVKNDGNTAIIVKNTELGNSGMVTYQEMSAARITTHQTNEYKASEVVITDSMDASSSITIKSTNVISQRYDTNTKNWVDFYATKDTSGISYTWTLGVYVYADDASTPIATITKGNSATIYGSAYGGKKITAKVFMKITADATDFSWYYTTEPWHLTGYVSITKILKNVTVIATDGMASYQGTDAGFEVNSNGVKAVKGTDGIIVSDNGVQRYKANESGTKYYCPASVGNVLITSNANTYLSSYISNSVGKSYDTIICKYSSSSNLYLDIKPPVGYRFVIKKITSGGLTLKYTSGNYVYEGSNTTSYYRSDKSLEYYSWELIYCGEGIWLCNLLA